MRERLRRFFENPWVDHFLITLISLNFFCYIFQTDADFSAQYGKLVNEIELISVIIFTIELALRAISVKSPRDLIRPMMLVDFLAVIPFYLSFVSANTLILRILRISRLMRIAKLARYSSALARIHKAFAHRKDELIVTAMFFIIGLTVISIGIYYAEKCTNNPVFSSIPNAFWWSVITCTSVGYGDAYPITVLGKFIGVFAAILGVALHALLIGVVGAAFIEVTKKGEEPEESEKSAS